MHGKIRITHRAQQYQNHALLRAEFKRLAINETCPLSAIAGITVAINPSWNLWLKGYGTSPKGKQGGFI